MKTDANSLEIRFSKKSESKILASLSKKFADENCCNNIIADSAEFFSGKKVAVALFNGQILGYCYGDIAEEVKKRSYAEVGDRYFDLDEIYVLPDFRNMKIGERLFKFVEDYAQKQGCKTIRLNAVSKSYNQLLKFYIDKLEMNFISAYLIKKLN